MGLAINRLSKGDNDMTRVAEVRVCRTEDGEYVSEGDPQARFLAYGVGAVIAAEDVKRYDRFVANLPDEPAEAGDGVHASHAVWRTEGGDLVHEGDENAVTLAYAVGDMIDDADVDEYNDLGAPQSTDPPKAATPSANKRAAKPANK